MVSYICTSSHNLVSLLLANKPHRCSYFENHLPPRPISLLSHILYSDPERKITPTLYPRSMHMQHSFPSQKMLTLTPSYRPLDTNIKQSSLELELVC